MSPPEERVVIIDFGMGNLFSIKQACEYVGLKATIISNPADLLDSQAAILPGVGAFADAMENLKGLNLIDPIKKFVEQGRPLMGICLGMQLLMTESEEFGLHQGLNIIPGRVIKFAKAEKTDKGLKVPQVGWNRITQPPNAKDKGWQKSPLAGLAQGAFMYFVHSFYAVPDSKEIVLSLTTYEGIQYCSSLFYRSTFACQFHPERSGLEGLRVYQNWVEFIKNHRRP